MELRPLLVTRFANAALGVMGTGFAAALAVDPPSESVWTLPVAALGAVVGCGLAVRGYRLHVRCSDRTVRIHGWLRTRTVPASAITEVTEFPALRWRTASGRRLWTPLSAFAMDNGVIPAVRVHNQACLRRLTAWISSHR